MVSRRMWGRRGKQRFYFPEPGNLPHAEALCKRQTLTEPSALEGEDKREAQDPVMVVPTRRGRSGTSGAGTVEVGLSPGAAADLGGERVGGHQDGRAAGGGEQTQEHEEFSYPRQKESQEVKVLGRQLMQQDLEELLAQSQGHGCPKTQGGVTLRRERLSD